MGVAISQQEKESISFPVDLFFTRLSFTCHDGPLYGNQQGFKTNGMPERPAKSLPPIVSAIAETMGAKGLT
jgi:hypothetical protein